MVSAAVRWYLLPRTSRYLGMGLNGRYRIEDGLGEQRAAVPFLCTDGPVGLGRGEPAVQPVCQNAQEKCTTR